MNKKLILKVIGLIMMIEAALLVVPLLLALFYHEHDWVYFLITIAGSSPPVRT